MMKLTMKYAALTLVLLLFGAASALASPVGWPASYGDASHGSAEWQELATDWGSSGVAWRVYDGTSWSAWGHDTTLNAGDTIQFAFAMHKWHVGTHYADYLKAWVDWDQNGVFDDPAVIFKEEIINPADYGTSDYSGATFYYQTGLYTLAAGELFLRARVTCSESLATVMGLTWNDQWSISYEDYKAAFLATGYLGQGEVEEWNITVTPIPPSVLLLGSGLLGIVFTNRKRYLK